MAEIYKSSLTGWDQKKGMMTQAMKLGNVKEDIIEIPADNDINAGDIVWLTTQRSAVCLTVAHLCRSCPVTDKTFGANLCLLGIDRETDEPYTFKYANDTAVDILDNLGTSVGNGSANTHKISKPVNMTADIFVSSNMAQFICRSDKKTVSNTYQVVNEKANLVWTRIRPDMTLGMIAEWTLGNQYDNNGTATNKSAVNYDPSNWKNVKNFGIGLNFADKLTAAELKELGLYVLLHYKDSMVSETSYGKNYISTKF